MAIGYWYRLLALAVVFASHDSGEQGQAQSSKTSGKPSIKSEGIVAPKVLEVGKVAPELNVRDAFGTRRELATLKGKCGLLLTFFPKCFTFNCTNQVSALRDHYPELQKAKIEVWGISTDAADGPRGQKAFAKHLKLPFPLLPDADRSISLKFGAVQSREQMAARITIFIDKQGIVRWIDKQINPRTHGADVVARLTKEGYIPAQTGAATDSSLHTPETPQPVAPEAQ